MDRDIRPLLSFDGESTCVELARRPSPPAGAALTMEAWIYIQRHKPDAGIVVKVQEHGGGYALLLDRDGGAGFVIEPSSGTERQYLCTSSGALRTEQWHHVAGTFDGATMTLYVDGREKATCPVAAARVDIHPEGDLFIGGDPRLGGEGHVFHGKIGEVRLWDTARSPDEIKRNMAVQLREDEPNLVVGWPFSEWMDKNITENTFQRRYGSVLGPSCEALPRALSAAAVVSCVAPRPPVDERRGARSKSDELCASLECHAVLDTGPLLAVAVERLNRTRVLTLLEQMVRMIDDHGQALDGKLTREVDALRAQLERHIEAASAAASRPADG